MAKIGTIRDAIEHDLTEYESGGFDFVFMVWYDSIGMVIPHKWIDEYPEWLEEYERFMSGQTVCLAGVYHRDIRHFLCKIESDLKRDNSKIPDDSVGGSPE